MIYWSRIEYAAKLGITESLEKSSFLAILLHAPVCFKTGMAGSQQPAVWSLEIGASKQHGAGNNHHSSTQHGAARNSAASSQHQVPFN